MRRSLFVAAGMVLSVACYGQSPVVRLGQAVPVEGLEPIAPVVRGATPEPKRTAITPLFGNRVAAKQTPPADKPAAPGSGGTLPNPRPVEGNPNVTEIRQPGPGTGTVIPPPTTLQPGPIIGQSYPVVPGPVLGAGYPYSYHGVPTGPIPAPVGGPIGGPIASPVSPEIPYDPAVAPSPPAYVGGGGPLTSEPRLADPYWGWGDPLFPRVRNTVSSTLSNSRLTLGGEFLLWFVRAQSLPPLLTTSSPAFNGIIGQGDTRVIYGNQTPTDTRHSGGRLSAVYQMTDLWALDGNIWFLGRNGSEFRATSDQYPVLARPFFNVNTNSNFSQLIASPGLSTGAASVLSETSLWGNEINIRRGLFCFDCSRIDGLVGFRNVNLTETLEITETFQRTANSDTGIGVPTVTGGTVFDRFRTENHFYGVNIGLAGELQRGWWFVHGRAAVGLGSVNQQVQITGGQALTTSTGGVVTANGGLLALPGANIGNFSQSVFGVVPEVQLGLGLNLTERLRFSVGYNFMYINSVIRPSGVIDQGLDVNRIPNFPISPAPPAISGVRPSPAFRTTDFFAQGINFSLLWTW